MLTQEMIEALAVDYAPILNNESMSYDEKQGYMLSELIHILPPPLIDANSWNSVRLYAGYIVAAGLRNAPKPIDIDAVITNLI